MAYGKKRRFSKKSSRKGSRKFRRGRSNKSVKVRIAKVERVLRQRKPELKHKLIFPPSLAAATKDVTLYPNPTGASGGPFGAWFGPADGIFTPSKGTGENQRIGGSIIYASCKIAFRFMPPDPSAVWSPMVPGYDIRKIRMMVVQFKSREDVFAGTRILPYTDVEASYLLSSVDPEHKEQKAFKIIMDRMYTPQYTEIGGVAGAAPNQYALIPKKETIQFTFKPHWPLIWDDDAVNPDQPINPIYVYFWGDVLHNTLGANYSVRFLSAQHYWRDNS